MNELDLFTEALNRTDPAERAAFLDQACAGNPDLRRRLEELLAGHARSRSPLDRPPVAPGESSETVNLATGQHRPDEGTETLAHVDPKAATDVQSGASTPPTEAAGVFRADRVATIDHSDSDATTPAASKAPSPRAARVTTGEGIGAVIAGRYTLVDVIGEGGMGSVYLASQTEPVKRQVALKLIKTGIDSRGVLARFDAERQALALMDHPNIARIYDGGLTPAGEPFFVMELVRGVPLTEYCDRRRLTVKARLELFVAACQAVQHAHQKGIIHRDLKPGNVLVTEVDGRPTPKVIDFGVAKATEQKLTDMSLADVGAIVGTPAYMSPEQADPTSMDIDTRTDVYALGVVLYELLTGSPPIDARRFQRGAILEMLRMVREVDPPRPSTKLSTAEALPNIAANRGTEPARLAKLLRGELDWVVMKALEKDRARRYDTANGFARDIQRYLADEVVEARPPGRGYRLRKFVKRNRVQVIAASLVASALLAGFLGTAFGMVRADQRRREAERNLAFARKGNQILGSVFAGLDPRKNYADLGEFSSALRDNLRKAARDLEGSAIGDPLEVAAMQHTLALSLFGLGEYDQSVPLFEKSLETRKAGLGPDHPDTLTSMGNLATGYELAGNYDRAIPLFEATLARAKARLGPDHPDTLGDMGNLATAYQRAGKLDKALPLFEETLALTRAKLGPDRPDTLVSMVNLAGGYLLAGKVDRALPLYEEALALMKARLGPDHPHTLQCMDNLAYGYRQAGKLDQTQRLNEEALALTKARLGPDHPHTLTSMNNLAATYWSLNRLDRSIPLFEEVLPLEERKRGRNHPATITTIANLGVNYKDAGRLREAIPLLEEAYPAARKLPAMTWVGWQLLDAYTQAGERTKLDDLIQEQLKEGRETLPADSPQLAGLLAAIGRSFLQQARWAEAEPPLREGLAIREKAEPELASTFNTKSMLGGALLGQKKYAEAEPLLLAGYEGMKRHEATITPQKRICLPEAVDRLIAFYTATNDPDKVAKWQAERAKYPAKAPMAGEK